MDEYKPINVHGILLTAVHDAVQVKNSTFEMNLERHSWKDIQWYRDLHMP